MNTKSEGETPIRVMIVDDHPMWRDAVERDLVARGYDVVDSEANFSLIGRFPDRHAVWQALCERGILIRETGPAGFLRVSAGTPDEMEAFYAALARVTAPRMGE